MTVDDVLPSTQCTTSCTNLMTVAAGFVPIRHKVISRYVKFFQSLIRSKSKEVRLIAELAAKDKSSTTGKNLAKMRQETGLNPWVTSPFEVRLKLHEADVKVPVSDEWRLPYLQKLLEQRHELELELLDTKEIDKFINIICSN